MGSPLCWPSITKAQPVPPPSTIQYCPILTQVPKLIFLAKFRISSKLCVTFFPRGPLIEPLITVHLSHPAPIFPSRWHFSTFPSPWHFLLFFLHTFFLLFLLHDIFLLSLLHSSSPTQKSIFFLRRFSLFSLSISLLLNSRTFVAQFGLVKSNHVPSYNGIRHLFLTQIHTLP